MFDKIYEIAQNSSNRQALALNLKDHYIDAVKVCDGMLVTAAAQLAITGEEEKVEWMRLLGADINAIAQGYARAGNHKKVEFYRAIMHSEKINVDMLAIGYALAGNDKQVEEYRTKHHASVDAIAHGYAIAGNDKQVEVYRTKHHASVHVIAEGYARAGNDKQVEIYRTQHAASVDAIAKGYALAGNHKEVDKYCSKHNANIQAVAQCYAVAGYHARVGLKLFKPSGGKFELITDRSAININAIAQAYALAGRHEKVEEYRTQHGADVKEIIEGYKLAGNHEKRKKYDINYLLDSYLEKRKTVVTASGTTKDYFYGNFFSIFQKSYKQKEQAVSALKKALQGEEVDLGVYLSTLRNGTLGKELRAFIKLGLANVIVNKKVDTVSGFVQALQDKYSKEPKKTI
jgi:hypothetical protein